MANVFIEGRGYFADRLLIVAVPIKKNERIQTNEIINKAE
jgi:hypothetical protein